MRAQLPRSGWFAAIGGVIDTAFGRSEDPAGNVAPGQAAVLKVGRETIAVYRDHCGAVHAVSAVCPHRQSIVVLDPDGPGWVCPRHGARFGVDGSIVDDAGLVEEPLPSRPIAGFTRRRHPNPTVS
ncbi:Rieske 2Fe-2S domain-containing protein [Mycolicibacterium llatzerense]|uniref:Rieske 2Fe-2S domain-containing protein n=1 Tax=Mycolicibacterium llatzerense TaxID=280871 RepID=UPI0008DC6C46|nr:Rieske 2Fe-2S domain-containing protein [Mycolicibacterium llatzerense]